MADQNPRELVAAFVDSFLGSERGFVPMSDMLPAMRDLASQFGASGFVCTMHPLPPTEPAEFPGPEGITKGWEDFGQAFASVEARIEGSEEFPGATVIDVEQRARTRHGDVEISSPVAVTITYERGLIATLQFHLDRKAAREAAAAGSPPS